MASEYDPHEEAYNQENDEWVCDCDETFDTLDQLKEHAKDEHPDVYESRYGSE